MTSSQAWSASNGVRLIKMAGSGEVGLRRFGGPPDLDPQEVKEIEEKPRFNISRPFQSHIYSPYQLKSFTKFHDSCYEQRIQKVLPIDDLYIVLASWQYMKNTERTTSTPIVNEEYARFAVTFLELTSEELLQIKNSRHTHVGFQFMSDTYRSPDNEAGFSGLNIVILAEPENLYAKIEKCFVKKTENCNVVRNVGENGPISGSCVSSPILGL